MATHTLLFGDLLAQIGCALGLALLSWRVTGFSGLRWFAWAYACSVAALLLILPSGPHPAAVIISRLLVVLAAILLTQGIADFSVSGSSVIGFGMVLLAVYGGAQILALFSRYNSIWSICLFAAAMTAQILVGIFVLVAHENAAERTACLTLAGVLAMVATLFTVRALLVFYGAASPEVMSSPLVEFGGTALHIAFSAIMAFGFVWLVAARLRNQLEGQASTDTLTGVLNRRAVNQAGEREIVRCRRLGAPLAVLAIDLDHFKQINDRSGHAAGDHALAAAAQALASGLRRTDRLARFGGEEFLALLPERDAPTAAAIAERLRQRVADLRLSLDGHILTLTASFGVAVLSDPGDSWDLLLRRADRCLYDAKRAGRNCARGPALPPVTEPIPVHGSPAFPLQ